MSVPPSPRRRRAKEAPATLRLRRTGAEIARPGVSVLLFDFGGTLDAEGVPWKRRLLRLWQEEVADIDPERFDRAFYEADDALVGALPAVTTLEETVRRLSGGLAERLSVADARAAERITARFCAEASTHLTSSAALLKRLADRYRLGIVSNFYGNLSAVCEETGLASHLSVAIDSTRIGFAKPDARIFAAALDALDARVSEALFVGDSLMRDMAGARGVGMRHVLLCGDGASSNGCCPEDRVIRRLADLPEVLAGMSHEHPAEIRARD